jgi:hypothetical protein
MNTSSKLFRVCAAVLAVGGLCWVLKFIVIAATDGAVSGLPDTLTAVLYIAAVLLMVAGMAGLGAALLAGRHPLLGVLGAIGGVVGWVASYALIGALVAPIPTGSGPSWLADELEIVVTGALLMTVGLLLARRTPQHERADAASMAN